MIPLRFRVLLWLLPTHVRTEHEVELAQFIELSEDSTGVTLAGWLGVAADVIRAAPAAHWDVFRQDLGYAARQLHRAAGFSTLAVLTLALGIGINAALFSVVDQVLFAPSPYVSPEGLARLDEEHAERGLTRFGVSPANFRDLMRDMEPDVTAAAVWQARSGTAQLEDMPERVSYAVVSGDFFAVFLEAPTLGRTLTPADDVPGATGAVISHAFWQTRFGGRPDVVGQSFLLERVPHTVLGVMPETLVYPAAVDLWKPLGMTTEDWQRRGARFLGAVLRLGEGVDVQRVHDRLAARAGALSTEFADTNEGWSIRVRGLGAAAVETVRTPLLLLWASAALILLIAVANVANLIVGRGVVRRREMAVRLAIGARSHRLVRQLFTEGLLLSFLGGLVGLGLAWILTRSSSAWVLTALPNADHVGLDVRSAAFTMVLVVVTAALASVVPAILAGHRNPASALREGRGGAGRMAGAWQARLVVGEVAVAVVVVTGTALLVQSMIRVLEQPLGYIPDQVTTFRIEPPFGFEMGSDMAETIARLEADRDRVSNAYRSLIDELADYPYVTGAGAVSRLPLTGQYWITGFALPDEPEVDDLSAYIRVVTPGYLEAMGTPVLRGRPLRSEDRAGAQRVVVIDDAFAQAHWGDSDPVGQSILLDGPPNEPRVPARIVGVVETIRQNTLDSDPRPTFYTTLAQALEGHGSNWGMDVVVRTRTEGIEASDLQAAARNHLPDAAVFRVRSMNAILRDSMARRQLQTRLLASFTGLALVLTLVGVYGVLTLSVGQRSREFGVRLALGASWRELIWSVQKTGLRWVVVGAVIGGAVSLYAVRFLESQVYGVSLFDPVAFISGPMALVIVAVLGAAVPALRALRTDPAIALRAE